MAKIGAIRGAAGALKAGTYVQSLCSSRSLQKQHTSASQSGSKAGAKR